MTDSQILADDTVIAKIEMYDPASKQEDGTYLPIAGGVMIACRVELKNVRKIQENQRAGLDPNCEAEGRTMRATVQHNRKSAELLSSGFPADEQAKGDFKDDGWILCGHLPCGLNGMPGRIDVRGTISSLCTTHGHVWLTYVARPTIRKEMVMLYSREKKPDASSNLSGPDVGE